MLLSSTHPTSGASRRTSVGHPGIEVLGSIEQQLLRTELRRSSDNPKTRQHPAGQSSSGIAMFVEALTSTRYSRSAHYAATENLHRNLAIANDKQRAGIRQRQHWRRSPTPAVFHQRLCLGLPRLSVTQAHWLSDQ